MTIPSLHPNRPHHALHRRAALFCLLSTVFCLHLFADDDISDLMQSAKPVTTSPAEVTGPQTQPSADLPNALGTLKSQTPAAARIATVALNNGPPLHGQLWTTLDTPFRLWIEDRKSYQDIDLALIKRIDVKVISQTMEDDWRWLKEGSDKKVFSGKKYPNIELAYTFTLLNDQKIEGTVVAPIYLLDDSTPPNRHALALYKKYKGKLDETLNDVVYIKSVELKRDASGKNDRAPVSEKLPLIY